MKLFLALSLLLAPLAHAETWNVDGATSKVNWEGSKIGGKHFGGLKVKSGKLLGGKSGLTGGEVEIDMKSLTVEDEMGADMKAKLDGHLRSDDFFSVEKNPTASLKITKVGPVKNGQQDVTGDLTIKSITKPVTFPATITQSGKNLNAKANIEVDRTAYDIKYRSLKFFSDLGDKVIHDKFLVKVDLNAKK